MAVVISDQLLDRSDRLLDAEPDAHLVGLAQTGHHAAFAAIVRRYEPELLGQARRLSSDGRAEDAVQQVFLNAFAALQAGGEVRHLRGWLHQILRNVVARGRVPADAPLDDVASHGETLEETVALRAQAHATLVELSALPDRQRDALLGTAVQGFPRSAVAQRMGLSEGAVRQLVHRARLRLRQAATALVPIPLGRWVGLARSTGGATGSETALGVGTAASGGLAIKVGTLVASGVVATGLAVTHTFPGHRHHSAAAPRAGAAARHRAAPARRGLTEAPAIGLTGTPVISAAPAVHRSVNGSRGRASSAGHAGLHETEPGSGGGRDDGRGHDSGARGQRGSGESGQSGRGGDGARGSRGDEGGRAGSGAISGRQSGSGSGSSASGGASSGRDGSGDGGSGSGSGGSGDGGSVSSGGSGSAVETGDSVASGGSGGTDGSGGSDGSGAGSGSVTTTSGSGTSGSGTSGSGSDGGQKDSGGSRDLSGSQVSSSS